MTIGGGFIKGLKAFLLPVTLLSLIDQSGKLLIARFFSGRNFDIIKGLLRFRPVQNTKLTFGGNYIPLFSNFWVALFLNLLFVFIMLSGFLFYAHKKGRVHLSVKITVALGLAGALCSLIDKVFWGGSLDFIQLPHLFTFDLKDCYLTAAEILFAIAVLRHQGEISLKEYFLFCMGRKTPAGR